MIFTSFFKALGQMGDRRFRRVLFLGVVLTIVLLVAATAGLFWLLEGLPDETGLPLIGPVTWLDDILQWSSVGVMLLLSVFLMVPVASAITSLFLDEVAQAVEDRHYPDLPPAAHVSFYDGFRDSVNFLGVIVGANLLALLVYIPLAFMAPVIFWALNGYLLGMEYFQLAAMRRIGRVKAKEMRKKHRWTIWLAGVLMAMPLSLPLINLVIPVLGAATFTHLFHRVQARE
ncbi:hypothetical protein EI983_13260 [Roseovarius faecimaris]|uniref:Sulfate transporter family protein n=1 Tax=Roseovarius faecimaris TaxID=2494550 RepID=A0A6I6ISK0_9RHOB|nr:EI24 domain-containing protein [Roseovarius faecimaris]QGX99182.1 hypothetical protein EI983_13260 [Roseovarius faecimaris]